MSSKLKSPLKWHGGDFYQAAWKLSNFPPIGSYKEYVSTCVGGANLECSMPPERYEGVSEVVNDLDGELMNFWDVLRVKELRDELIEALESTPFSKDMFEASRDAVKLNHGGLDRVSRAFLFFITNRQSRQGLMKDFATLSRSRTRRGMNEQVSSWLTAIEGLPEVHERVKRFVILNESMFDVLRREDSADTFFYIDPTYLHDTRVAKQAYRCELSERGHWILIEMLSVKTNFPGMDAKWWETLQGDEPFSDFGKACHFKLKGRFLLCGYESSLYNVAAESEAWRVEKRQFKNSSSSKKSKELKTECIWMNY